MQPFTPPFIWMGEWDYHSQDRGSDKTIQPCAEERLDLVQLILQHVIQWVSALTSHMHASGHFWQIILQCECHFSVCYLITRSSHPKDETVFAGITFQSCTMSECLKQVCYFLVSNKLFKDTLFPLLDFLHHISLSRWNMNQRNPQHSRGPSAPCVVWLQGVALKHSLPERNFTHGWLICTRAQSLSPILPVCT